MTSDNIKDIVVAMIEHGFIDGTSLDEILDQIVKVIIKLSNPVE